MYGGHIGRDPFVADPYSQLKIRQMGQKRKAPFLDDATNVLWAWSARCDACFYVTTYLVTPCAVPSICKHGGSRSEAS